MPDELYRVQCVHVLCDRRMDKVEQTEDSVGASFVISI